MTAPLVFDGTILGRGRITGVGRSFLNALAAYAPHAGRSCVLLLPARAEDPRIEGVHVVHAELGGLSRQLVLPQLLHRLGAALLHAPMAAIPLRAPCPVIATLHDLPWLHVLPKGEPGRGVRHRLVARLALRRAARVLVPSLATRADIERWAGPRAAARVVVVPHTTPLPASAADPGRLTGPFLVLGDDRPRKNLERVVAAHARAQTQDPTLPALQIAGPRRGYLNEAEKTLALRQARAVLHLSLLEGFGLPVLEAMAHGVPVVCSDIGALRELADDAALLVDPTDRDAMASALLRIHRDAELRTRLATAGRARAAAYAPARTVEAWQQVHGELLR
ncbi:MAG: glycosyltransferase [Planctomycetes bacterium]|nr:glycosyltransferase [Planctomycetota bacterium]